MPSGPGPSGTREELVFLGKELSEQRNYSEEIAVSIDSEIRELIRTAENTARDILIANKSKLVQLAEYVMQVETLDGDELDAAFDAEPTSDLTEGGARRSSGEQATASAPQSRSRNPPPPSTAPPPPTPLHPLNRRQVGPRLLP